MKQMEFLSLWMKLWMKSIDYIGDCCCVGTESYIHAAAGQEVANVLI